MEPIHRTDPTRRPSSKMSHPRPSERTRTSSSTSKTRHDTTSSRPIRAHHDSTSSQRSSRPHRDSGPAGRRTMDSPEEVSEEPEEWEHGTTVGNVKKKRRRKRDEPMSPIAVVCYVVFFYVIWQILTRSDETEILGHLSLPHLQSLSSSFHSDLRPQQQNQYHLPYHLPQIPSPIPNVTGENPSAGRTLMGVVMYPFYLLITIIAIPFPLILNILHILLQVVGTVLYPITATARLLGRTFILAPLGVVTSAITVFYPLYVFIAGVIGVGCVLGLGVGWAGRVFLDVLFGRKRRSPGVRGPIPGTKSRSSISGLPRKKTIPLSSGEEREHIRTPIVSTRLVYEEDEEDDDYVPERYIAAGNRSKSGFTQSRDSQVVGLRKRGVRGTSFR